jgi:hypothetical protein
MEIGNQLESVLRPSNIKNRVAEPEPKLLAGAGAGAGISKFRLRLPAPGQLKYFEKFILNRI